MLSEWAFGQKEEEEEDFFDFSKGKLYYIPLRIQIDIYKLIYIQIRDL